MAEGRVILAGVSDRAAVAGRTHKHPAKVPLTASRSRPVRAWLCVLRRAVVCVVAVCACPRAPLRGSFEKQCKHRSGHSPDGVPEVQD